MTRLYAEAVKQVAQEQKVHVVDVWTAIDTKARESGGLAKYLSDGLHLTAEGYEVVTFGKSIMSLSSCRFTRTDHAILPQKWHV